MKNTDLTKRKEGQSLMSNAYQNRTSNLNLTYIVNVNHDTDLKNTNFLHKPWSKMIQGGILLTCKPFLKESESTNFSLLLPQSLLFIAGHTKTGHTCSFHLYLTPYDGVVAVLQNDDKGIRHIIERPAALRMYCHGAPATNRIAFYADAQQQLYHLFVNGVQMMQLPATPFSFLNDIAECTHVSIGSADTLYANFRAFEGEICSLQVFPEKLSVDQLKQLTQTDSSGIHIFYAGDTTNANYFRIPSLLSLSSGTILAAADARYGGAHDSKSKINIALSRSTDGGISWQPPTLPLRLTDYCEKAVVWPRDIIGRDWQIQGSASYIDAVLLEDRVKQRIFLFADLMPAGIGVPNAQKGSGFCKIDTADCLLLKKQGDVDYQYTVRAGGVIYDSKGTPTTYSIDNAYCLYENGTPLQCNQYDYHIHATGVQEASTDIQVPMSIFSRNALFQVFPTTYLALCYSDDDGKTWSKPRLISTFKPEHSRYLVFGPGVGKQLTQGRYRNRLLVPVYAHSSSDFGVIYSDDHGESWTYVEADDLHELGAAEGQIVEMPDGSVKAYLRTRLGHIAEISSIDGGEHWSNRKRVAEIPTTSYGTQLSVINYSKPIDGHAAILLSTPCSENARRDGRIWIGLIEDTLQDSIERYHIHWKYCYKIDAPQVGYSYSCLTELPDGRIGLHYEKYDSWCREELHLQNTLHYDIFSIQELLCPTNELHISEPQKL